MLGSFADVELKLGDRIVSDFSGREGTVVAVYTTTAKVDFGYDEPVVIGLNAAKGMKYWTGRR